MLLTAASAASTAASAPSTTSIPTWLVVLVPVLAALVSGIAGTVGALLGSRTAARTAERVAERTAALTERLEGRRWADEMWRWNRERREQTYRAFLVARDRFLTAKWRVEALQAQLKKAGQAFEVTGELVDLADDCAQQWKALGDRLAEVDLFGSLAAREIARGWVMSHTPPPVGTGLPTPHTDRRRAESGHVYAVEPDDDALVALVRQELKIDE